MLAIFTSLGACTCACCVRPSGSLLHKLSTQVFFFLDNFIFAKDFGVIVPLYSENIYQLNFSSYHGLSYSPYSYTPHHLPYYAAHLSIPAFGLHGLPYNGLPYSGVPAYNSLPTLVYNTLASVSTEVEEEE